MENYAIQLLKDALNEELRHLATVGEVTRSNGFRFNSATMEAFSESRRLAESRIPDLQNAIEQLSNKN